MSCQPSHWNMLIMLIVLSAQANGLWAQSLKYVNYANKVQPRPFLLALGRQSGNILKKLVWYGILNDVEKLDLSASQVNFMHADFIALKLMSNEVNLGSSMNFILKIKSQYKINWWMKLDKARDRCMGTKTGLPRALKSIKRSYLDFGKNKALKRSYF